MRRLCCRRTVSLSCCFTLLFLAAQSDLRGQGTAGANVLQQGEPRFVGIVVEQDLFVPGRNQDRNYTGGLGFTTSGSFLRSVPVYSLMSLADSRFASAPADRQRWGMLLAASGFTPDDLNTVEPVRDDRPYASLLVLGAQRTYASDDAPSAWRTELVVGLLGLRLAEDVQTWIHQELRSRSGEITPYDPLGWSNQISDGGEPTALYRATYLRQTHGDFQPAGFGFDLSIQAGGSAGYYTNVHAGSDVRIGWRQSEFWEFNSGSLNSLQQRAGSGTGRELFFFASLRPRLVLYNALLQGQFKSSAHTLDSDELRRGVLEFESGLSGALPVGGVTIGGTWIVRAGRTAEFTGVNERTHHWGSLQAFVSWR